MHFNKKTLLAAFAVLSAVFVSCSEEAVKDYSAFVNPKIGTGGHGHVFVGASVPFGAVQLGPTSIPQSWDWCSGYHDSDSTVIGFSHTHLNGTGIGDLFDVTVMPVTGEVTYARGTEADPASGLWSYADRREEICEPSYYSVPLMRYGIKVELTATERVGLHRYTFPASDDAAIVFDLENGGCWDDVTDAGFQLGKDDDGNIVSVAGWRFSKGWARDQRLFFYGVLNAPVKHFEEHQNTNEDSPRGNPRPAAKYGRISLGSTSEGDVVMLKVAISPVSIEGAKANLEAELPGWDFEGTVAKGREEWNKELSKIRIDTEDEDAKTIFYTALYHTMVTPSVFNDVDKSYRGADREVHPKASFTNYTTFSLWDTYRAQMPLMTVIHPEKMNDIVNTMLAIHKEQGKLPVWHLHGCETDCMVGNPGVIVVADAITKGYRGFDREEAFNALKASVMLDERGQDLRKKYGYIPTDLINEGIGKDMEYAIADGAVAAAAKYLGKAEDERFFTERSHSYRNYFDPAYGLMRGKFADGSFVTPFNPFASNHSHQDYTEGTAWQYVWLVPQDVDGLMNLFGSKEAMVQKLDSLFTVSSEVQGENASPDISGLIGQYAHGNEPSHHTIYLYCMLGEQGKAVDRLRQVYDEMYLNGPDGLAGNEDCGQMSAWYILSTLGLYQVEPAGARFWFGAPLFDKASVKVSGGRFDIIAKGVSDTNRYIQSVTLNGKPYDKPWISFEDIYRGGELEFTMGDTPVSIN